MAESRYVLVEFDPAVSYGQLMRGVRRLSEAGYWPILAHIERNFCLREHGLEEIFSLGCYLQMNFASLQGHWYQKDVRWCRKQVEEGRIQFLGTDLHRTDFRPPVITEAVAKALAAYPQVNVSVDGYNILFKKHINIGIAVSLNDGNLIVPVVHDADHLNLNGLAVAIDSLALKARDNKLMPDDIDGGTFTITNFGTFKSLFGTPVINQPQVAILGVGYIEKKPAVIETPEGDTIAIRHKMYLSLSYDHRVVDGMLGGNFLHFIADYLENWKG